MFQLMIKEKFIIWNKREVHNLEEDKEELEEEEDRELKMVSELVGGKEESQRGSCLQS